MDISHLFVAGPIAPRSLENGSWIAFSTLDMHETWWYWKGKDEQTRTA